MKPVLKKRLKDFCELLSTRDCIALTSDDEILIYDFINSDGCDLVPDFHLGCCVVHDFYYTFHIDFHLKPITRAQADAKFRACLQKRSLFGKLSPMATWRWAGVRIFGGKA